MKIKVGKRVYLQEFDFAFITHDLERFPARILEEFFQEERVFIMNGEKDGFRFDCVFEWPENVKWLMGQDWIIDFDEYAGRPIEKIEELRDQISEEWRVKADEFNAKDEAYKAEHYAEIHDEALKIEHKESSLDFMIEAYRRKIKFVFPKEYGAPSNFRKKRSFFSRFFRDGVQ